MAVEEVTAQDHLRTGGQLLEPREHPEPEQHVQPHRHRGHEDADPTVKNRRIQPVEPAEAPQEHAPALGGVVPHEHVRQKQQQEGLRRVAERQEAALGAAAQPPRERAAVGGDAGDDEGRHDGVGDAVGGGAQRAEPVLALQLVANPPQLQRELRVAQGGRAVQALVVLEPGLDLHELRRDLRHRAPPNRGGLGVRGQICVDHRVQGPPAEDDRHRNRRRALPLRQLRRSARGAPCPGRGVPGGRPARTVRGRVSERFGSGLPRRSGRGDDARRPTRVANEKAEQQRPRPQRVRQPRPRRQRARGRRRPPQRDRPPPRRRSDGPRGRAQRRRPRRRDGTGGRARVRRNGGGAVGPGLGQDPVGHGIELEGRGPRHVASGGRGGLGDDCNEHHGAAEVDGGQRPLSQEAGLGAHAARPQGPIRREQRGRGGMWHALGGSLCTDMRRRRSGRGSGAAAQWRGGRCGGRRRQGGRTGAEGHSTGTDMRRHEVDVPRTRFGDVSVSPHVPKGVPECTPPHPPPYPRRFHPPPRGGAIDVLLFLAAAVPAAAVQGQQARESALASARLGVGVVLPRVGDRDVDVQVCVLPRVLHANAARAPSVPLHGSAARAGSPRARGESPPAGWGRGPQRQARIPPGGGGGRTSHNRNSNSRIPN